MEIVKVRNLILGKGCPKICVPIVGTTKEEILKEATRMHTIPVDLVEWRADWFQDVNEIEKVGEILGELREVLMDIPLLFTFRTAKEGGERAIEDEYYKKLNLYVAASGCVDLVDVEAFTGEEFVKDMIRKLHLLGVKVIASNHDFNGTPERDEIVRRLCYMQELGADLPKIAVMPQDKKDLLTLLCATEEMVREYARRPIITMSMARTGVISRLVGETFGSALTFGAAAKASAPGQIGVSELKDVLTIIHKSM